MRILQQVGPCLHWLSLFPFAAHAAWAAPYHYSNHETKKKPKPVRNTLHSIQKTMTRHTLMPCTALLNKLENQFYGNYQQCVLRLSILSTICFLSNVLSANKSMSTAEPLFEGPTKNNSPNLIEHYMQVLSTPCILLAFLGTLIWEFWYG